MAEPGGDRDDADDVMVQVCIECGKEYTYEGEPPAEMECGKCGGVVFRSFMSDGDDEAQADFRETTERDLGTDDGATDVTQGDLHDLRNL